jgi:hypothetical protein
MATPFTPQDFDIFDDAIPNLVTDSWKPIVVDVNKLSKYFSIRMQMIERIE